MQQVFFCNECVSAGIAVFSRCSGWTRRSQNSIDYFVNYVVLFGVFYGSIVSHSMSEKTRQTK